MKQPSTEHMCQCAGCFEDRQAYIRHHQAMDMVKNLTKLKERQENTPKAKAALEKLINIYMDRIK